MAQVVRRPDGSFAVVMPDGTRAPLSPEMLHDIELPMSDVLQEAGLQTGERITFKALSNSPELGRQYLESLGYETRRLPEEAGPWNFAVRKSAKEPWRMIDPLGVDAGDFLDLIGDVIIGAPTGAGAAVGSLLGPIGTFLGAGAGAAVGEAGRQALGSLAGVPQEIEPGRVALEGALGAASVPVSAVVGAGFRGLGRFAVRTGVVSERVGVSLASKMIGIRNAERFPSEKIGRLRAERPGIMREVRGAGEHAPGFVTLMDDMTRSLRGTPLTITPPIRRGVVAQLNAASTPGRLMSTADVDIRSGLSKIYDIVRRTKGKEVRRRFVRGPKGRLRVKEKIVTERTVGQVPSEIRTFLNIIDQRLKAAGDRTIAGVPVRQADDFIDLALSIAESKGARGEVEDALVHFATEVEKDLLNVMDSAGFKLFRRDYAELGQLRKDLLKFRAQTLPGAAHVKRLETTSRFLKQLDGDDKLGYMALLSDIERKFGYQANELTNIVRDVTVSRATPHRGAMPIIGQLAATGQFRGAAMFGGVGTGALVGAMGGGGLPGAIAGGMLGGAAGAVLGSPPIQLQAMRGAIRVGQAITGAERILTPLVNRPSVQFVGIAGTQEALRTATAPIADTVVAREKPRKRVHVGQF